MHELQTLSHFIGASQLMAMHNLSQTGPERDWMRGKIKETADLVSTMPETYQQDGAGEEAIAYLHYFMGDMDWYIIERDSDPDGDGQIQAFGYADLGMGFPELGYICIPELLACGAELDLHFEPMTLKAIREKHETDSGKRVDSVLTQLDS